MYLVLTALLALQVSSALIYKFQSLNESLEHTVKETTGWNTKKLTGIADEVKVRGSRADEVQLVAAAQKVSKESKAMLNYIEDLKNELIKESGGYEEDGSLKGAKEETKIEVIMIGANKTGKGYELRKKLDEYVKFMNQNSVIQFSPLALDAREDPLFRNNDEQKNKDFVELNFGQTPLVAGLAILSEIQSRIATMEATMLNDLNKKIAFKDYKVDIVKPMASPASRVVAAGTKYEAQVFMTAASSTQKPVIVFGDRPIEVDKEGIGKISFTASGGSYGPDNTVKKTWTGKITMKKPEGGDTTYLLTEEYIVAKPIIQVQSAAVQALYRNCGNKLNIQVPALGNTYNPRITADGATVIPGGNRGFVTVVPTGPTVSLKVSSDGNYIGEERYRVKLIPVPNVEVKVNNRKVDPMGVDGLVLRNLSVKAIPDADFANSMPDDATYRIVEWKVTLARGRNATAPPVTYTTEGVNIGALAQNARTGDKLIIEIKKVKRKNFRGEWEESPVNGSVQIIPIN